VNACRWTCKVCRRQGTDGPRGWLAHVKRTGCDRAALPPSAAPRPAHITPADWERMSWAARQRSTRLKPSWRLAAHANRALLDQRIAAAGRHVTHSASTLGATA